MKNLGRKGSNSSIDQFGLTAPTKHWNLHPAALIERTIKLNQGKLTSMGALAVNTGEFTGRSPKDRFIVEDDITRDTVYWGDINIPMSEAHFDGLYEKVTSYLNERSDLYVRDAYACAHFDYRLNVRVVTEYPWQNLFANNMFLRPTDVEHFEPAWTILAAPGCMADADVDGTRQHNFAAINFTKKLILIGGTAYTGEIKKGIFSVLNYILPKERDVLSMHCSANVGSKSDTSLFFGLSGTGKTTLSTDPERQLIGDDEHGWSKANVFNFEGGCYAKTINLSESKEPQIYRAIKFGAMIENVGFEKDGYTVNFDDTSITQNTRVSYPIHHIDNIVYNSRGDVPQNIFFLTCDAFGVLPPISKLTPAQAMYHFISGYTAKVAGTEAGINEPLATFSSCFGAPFLPLHPTFYARMLGDKIAKGHTVGNGVINVWLVNTGWTGGPYGTGKRMELSHTRATIRAALKGTLNKVSYETDPVFGLSIPTECPDIPNGILNPRNAWTNTDDYDHYANILAKKFVDNFKAFESEADAEILSAAPKVGVAID